MFVHIQKTSITTWEAETSTEKKIPSGQQVLDSS